MVLLTMTTSIVEAVTIIRRNSNDTAAAPLSAECEAVDEPTLTEPEVGNPISHGQIIDIWKHLKEEEHPNLSLEELLRGATIYMPPPPPKPEPVRIVRHPLTFASSFSYPSPNAV